MLVGFISYLLAFSPSVRRAHTRFGSLFAGPQPGTAGAGSPRVRSAFLGCVSCPGEVPTSLPEAPTSLPVGHCSPLPAAAALRGLCSPGLPRRQTP